MQLPPIAIGQHELIERWLKRDIFEQARIVKAIKENNKCPNMVMLDTQRRMHEQIAQFASHLFYRSRLKNHNSVKDKQTIADLEPFSGMALALINLNNLGRYALKEWDRSSRFNILSQFYLFI